MGKKYIIELEREETAYKTVNSNGVPLIQLLAPTPYTEPDLEQVRKDAYDRGYDDAKYGYENGFENGMIVAWDAARKIANMPYGDGEKIFGVSGWHIIEKYTADEVIAEIKALEESKKEQSVTVEDVMRQYLNEFCHNVEGCAECPLNTSDFTCGRGYHFIDAPVSDEEVRRAYAKVVKEK